MKAKYKNKSQYKLIKLETLIMVTVILMQIKDFSIELKLLINNNNLH